MRTIYTAPTVEAAESACSAFTDSQWGRKYPTAVRTWSAAWERFIPFLAFPPAVRKIIYTTNTIESLNYQLRKIIKNRGHFPNDQAAVKLLWLAICNIEDKRALERAKRTNDGLGPQQAESSTGRRRTSQRLEASGWKQALGALVLNYPERLDEYIT